MVDPSTSTLDIEQGETGEDEPLIQTVECRICQEKDNVKNLEIPCACNGSLKYAHRTCVQRWCNEKGDITCEICHQHYQPGYTAPPPPQREDTTVDISGGWTIAGTSLDLHDPADLEAEYKECAAFCRSTVLFLMVLILFRDALIVGNDDRDDDDASTYFSLFLLRAAGFLLPCYIMAWAISALQHRRLLQHRMQRQVRSLPHTTPAHNMGY